MDWIDYSSSKHLLKNRRMARRERVRSSMAHALGAAVLYAAQFFAMAMFFVVIVGVCLAA